MTRVPRPPLDADERAVAAMLPRPPGREGPDAALDARILAAARAPLAPPRPRRRRSWVVPASLAASLVLAVGLAWQLRPPPPALAPAMDEAAPAAAAATPDSPPPPPPPPRSVVAPLPPPPAAAPPAPIASRAVAVPAEPQAQPVPPPPPPPPPSPIAADAMAAPVPRSAAAAPQAATKASPPAAAPAAADSAARAATAARGREASAAQAAEAAVDAPGEDVPPATMDSPEARQAWLDRIDALLDQGRIEEARASLAEFRRRYPDAALPPELDALEP